MWWLRMTFGLERIEREEVSFPWNLDCIRWYFFPFLPTSHPPSASYWPTQFEQEQEWTKVCEKEREKRGLEITGFSLSLLGIFAPVILYKLFSLPLLSHLPFILLKAFLLSKKKEKKEKKHEEEPIIFRMKRTEDYLNDGGCFKSSEFYGSKKCFTFHFFPIFSHFIPPNFTLFFFMGIFSLSLSHSL